MEQDDKDNDPLVDQPVGVTIDWTVYGMDLQEMIERARNKAAESLRCEPEHLIIIGSIGPIAHEKARFEEEERVTAWRLKLTFKLLPVEQRSPRPTVVSFNPAHRRGKKK